MLTGMAKYINTENNDNLGSVLWVRSQQAIYEFSPEDIEEITEIEKQ
ncbi:hypothetical protein [Allofustis seminis]|nr:hypothetical protein [Allofustis seminis]